ncbi:MAG: hypothetical protein HWN81_19905 [Candidatus Lokiarchaeota archaeon]|nr:hypothetical protein [Candidatus Lokiarchaeota archaeon]
MNLKRVTTIKKLERKMPIVEIRIFLDKIVKGNTIIRKFINARQISI